MGPEMGPFWTKLLHLSVYQILSVFFESCSFFSKKMCNENVLSVLFPMVHLRSFSDMNEGSWF